MILRYLLSKVVSMVYILHDEGKDRAMSTYTIQEYLLTELDTNN